MFLQPSEVGFLKHLKEARVPVVEFEFPTKRIVNVQSQLEKLVGQNYYLNKVRPARALLRLLSSAFLAHLLTPSRLFFLLPQSAKDGYRSYLQAYASHSLRSVFNVHALDLVKVAKSFGFTAPPRVDLTLGASMSRDRKTEGRRAYGSQPRQQSGVKRWAGKRRE